MLALRLQLRLREERLRLLAEHPPLLAGKRPAAAPTAEPRGDAEAGAEAGAEPEAVSGGDAETVAGTEAGTEAVTAPDGTAGYAADISADSTSAEEGAEEGGIRPVATVEPWPSAQLVQASLECELLHERNQMLQARTV